MRDLVKEAIEVSIYQWEKNSDLIHNPSEMDTTTCGLCQLHTKGHFKKEQCFTCVLFKHTGKRCIDNNSPFLRAEDIISLFKLGRVTILTHELYIDELKLNIEDILKTLNSLKEKNKEKL